MQDLLDRQGELETLSRLVKEASAGRGRIALVEGEPGIGKTALLQAAGGLAEGAGVVALAAQGTELEREFGFGVVRQLLERRVLDEPGLMSGAAAHAAPVLGTGETPLKPGSDGFFAALHGLYWLIDALAGSSPLVLLVDDAHWADEESLRFLAYLARRLQGLPVAVVVGTRSGRALESRPVLAALGRDGAEVLRPSALGRQAVAAAVQRELGGNPDDQFVAAAQAATGGNPFLLGELLREARSRDLAPDAASASSLSEMGPQAVSRALLLRLDRLAPGARDLAVAVSVLGRDPDRAYAPALAGLEASEAGARADELAEEGILARGQALEPAHPIVRQAIYGSVSPGARGQAHMRAARLLHERGAAAEAVAAHLLEVPPAASEWAVQRLREAAARATARGAPARSVEFLGRAMAEPPPDAARASVARELAEQQALAGDPAAVDGFRRALELETDPSVRTELSLAMGRLLFIQARLHEQRELLLATTEECPDEAHESRLQLAAQILAVDRMLPGDPPALPERLRFDPDELDGNTPGERALLVGLALEAVQLARPTGRALELARRTLGDGRLLSEEGAASATYLNALLVLTLADELETLDAWIERAEQHARISGDLAGHAAALAFGTNAAFRRGEVGEAVEQAREALAAASARELPVLIGVAITYALEALVEAGNLEEADALLMGTGMAGELPEIFHFAAILARRGRLRVAQGRAEEGLDDLLDAGRRLVRGRSTNPSFARWRSDAARTLAALGRGEEASALAAEELELARATGQRSSIGIALRAVAAVGPPAEAFEPLADAVETLAESPDRLQEAHALADLGAALRAAGQPSEAREPLRRALEYAVRSGAEPLAGRARDELAAAGARPRRVALSGPDSLTPGEARCARMAASGMSNREIAQSLFVTVRAVEMHLTNAYRKLEIGSRRELAEALSRPAEPT